MKITVLHYMKTLYADEGITINSLNQEILFQKKN